MKKSLFKFHDDKDLLVEYGRAFYWINMIEFALGNELQDRSGLDKVSFDVREKLMEHKTLGMKIRLIEGLISKDLFSRLKELNKKRVLLAHGVIVSDDKKHVLYAKRMKPTKITKKMLNDVIELAGSIIKTFSEEWDKNRVKV